MAKQVKNKNKVKKNFQSNKILHVYRKKFASFGEMIEELRTLHPEMNNIFIFDQIDDINTITPGEIADEVLNYFIENRPDIENRVNLPVNFYTSSNRVQIKTAYYFSFNWQFKYDKNGNYSDLSVGIAVYEIKDNADEAIINMLECLEAAGWTKIEKTDNDKNDEASSNEK